MLHQVVVFNYTMVMEANYEIMFQIVVQEHKVLQHVAHCKILQLAIQVINFKALELSGSQHSADMVNLIPEAVHMLLWNCLGWTVVQLHVSAQNSRRKL
jgi:hypothetical protein